MAEKNSEAAPRTTAAGLTPAEVTEAEIRAVVLYAALRDRVRQDFHIPSDKFDALVACNLPHLPLSEAEGYGPYFAKAKTAVFVTMKIQCIARGPHIVTELDKACAWIKLG